MNCKQIRQTLPAFVDGELGGRDMILTRRHLEDCAACAKEEACVRTLKGMLAELPTCEPPEGFEVRLMQAVKVRRGQDSTRSLIGFRILTGLVAASALLTFAALAVLHRRADPNVGGRDSMIDFEIERDQAYIEGSDGMRGRPVVVPTSYAHP